MDVIRHVGQTVDGNGSRRMLLPGPHQDDSHYDDAD
jgi:hypothetical protein